MEMEASRTTALLPGIMNSELNRKLDCFRERLWTLLASLELLWGVELLFPDRPASKSNFFKYQK